MPKITINERDLTTVAIDNITDNVAYIPGYAITGPINTPTLCRTLAEFQSKFGYLPYEFKNTYTYANAGFTTLSDKVFIAKGQREKSYIYAAELLKKGLPVLFERVMDTTTATSFIAKAEVEGITIAAKYSGVAGTYINYMISGTAGAYTLKIKVDAPADSGIKSTSEITYDISINADGILTPVVSDYITVSYTHSGDELPDIPTTVPVTWYALSIADSSADELTPGQFYTALQNADFFKRLSDKNEYQIKFITSGGYPTLEYANYSIVTNMLKASATRGDCISILDHANITDRAIIGDSSLQSLVSNIPSINVGEGVNIEDARRYGTVFTPYATFAIDTLDGASEELPGSFSYLISLAASIQTNPNWYAVAGVTRGLVPNLLQLSQNVTGAIADALQPEIGISINPITNIKPYGYCIWGNRTLNNNDKGLIASSFLNIRMLANDVKKVVYAAAKKLTFELNTDILWLNFKAEIEPTLDKMVSGNGLTGYRILRKATTKRATIEAVIRLFVVEAVEDWDITIELSDTTVTVQ